MNKDFISIKQEVPESINLLAAMRHTYSQAKFIRYFRLSITLLIPIISIISIKFFPSIALTFPLFSSFWLIIDQIILTRMEEKSVVDAAKIQEMFDVNLFSIEWNKILVGEKPLSEDILILSQKFKGNKDDLKFWYQGLNAQNHFSNVLLSQRTNITWDKNLRVFYSKILIFGCWVLLIILVAFSFFLNISFQTFILSLLVPSLPLILHLSEVYASNKKRYQSLEMMTLEVTDQVFKNISNLSEKSILKKCRQYQDYIYLKRCDKNTIPDKIYWIKKNTYDKLAKKVNEDFSDSI